MSIETFPPEEVAKIRANSKPVWDEWIAERVAEGLPGQELFDQAKARGEEIRAAAEAAAAAKKK